MKIITYNVNGIRAAVKKGFLEWLQAADPDVLCLQETKAQPDQIPVLDFMDLGYTTYSFSAKKKGYSGVAILSKQQPTHVEYGMGIEKYDNEGRFIRADFGELSVASIYHPSGSSGDERQTFKMEWLSDFAAYVQTLKQTRKHLVLAGDYNICHKPIDIHDPKRNAKSSGFLPEEREWMTQFLAMGYIDAFRELNKNPDNYTWWSYRANARARNKGWRIDYQMLTKNMLSRLQHAEILSQAKHSDHCPLLIDIDY